MLRIGEKSKFGEWGFGSSEQLAVSKEDYFDFSKITRADC